jgi:hypothetical protein
MVNGEEKVDRIIAIESLNLAFAFEGIEFIGNDINVGRFWEKLDPSLLAQSTFTGIKRKPFRPFDIQWE